MLEECTAHGGPHSPLQAWTNLRTSAKTLASSVGLVTGLCEVAISKEEENEKESYGSYTCEKCQVQAKKLQNIWSAMQPTMEVDVYRRLSNLPMKLPIQQEQPTTYATLKNQEYPLIWNTKPLNRGATCQQIIMRHQMLGLGRKILESSPNPDAVSFDKKGDLVVRMSDKVFL